MSIGKVKEFDVAAGVWSSYIERLNMYFTVNNVSDNLKLPTLIAVMGDAAYELLVNLASPKKLSELKYEDAVAMLRNHLQPVPSALAERFRYRQRRQTADENIANYVAELKKLTRHCKMGENLSENLRDQFVCGLKSDMIRQRLFAEEDSLSFVNAVKLATSLEAAERDAAAVDAVAVSAATSSESAVGVHSLAAADSDRRRSSAGWGSRGARGYRLESRGATVRAKEEKYTNATCSGCGAAGHGYDACRFRNYVCSQCKKTGHRCPERGTGRSKGKDATLYYGEMMEHSDAEECGGYQEDFHHLCLNDYKAPYKLHKLDTGPSQTSTITAEDAIKLYSEMQLCRRLEAACATLYKEKVIRGFCHLYSGEEAIAVGVKAMIRPQDSVITAYRCHAWTFLMDVSAVRVMAELTGRKTGCSRGKGGSMHMYGKNFYGGNGIVGGQVPLGTGIGLVHKYKKDGGICFTMYGDGAANQGQVYEAFNIAKLWVLPMVYICENNKFGLGTAAARAAACTDYYTRGDYIPGIWVDGMDVLASMEATRYAIDWVSSGKGPIVLEMETYRYFGHSMSDPGTSYRSREEVQEVRKNRDPITNFREKILSKNLVTPEKLKEVDASVRKHIEEATAQATTDPETGLEELGADIYAEAHVSHVRGVRPDTPLPHLNIAKRQ